MVVIRFVVEGEVFECVVVCCLLVMMWSPFMFSPISWSEGFQLISYCSPAYTIVCTCWEFLIYPDISRGSQFGQMDDEVTPVTYLGHLVQVIPGGDLFCPIVVMPAGVQIW